MNCHEGRDSILEFPISQKELQSIWRIFAKNVLERSAKVPYRTFSESSLRDCHISLIYVLSF